MTETLEALGLPEALLPTYLLIAVRFSAAIVVMPVFGARGVPPHTKVGLALFLALVMLPLQEPVALPDGLPALIAAAVRETLVGVLLGFAVLLVLQGVELAGSLVGLQMGMGLGEVLDPLTGAGSNEFRRFYGLLAVLIFFLANAHHDVIRGLFASFEVVPLNQFSAADMNVTALVELSAGVFITATRIALPVVAAVFLTDLALALVARTMPQLNVLIVGLPVKVVVGLVVLIAALPATSRVMNLAFNGILNDFAALLAPAAQS